MIEIIVSAMMASAFAQTPQPSAVQSPRVGSQPVPSVPATNTVGSKFGTLNQGRPGLRGASPDPTPASPVSAPMVPAVSMPQQPGATVPPLQLSPPPPTGIDEGDGPVAKFNKERPKIVIAVKRSRRPIVPPPSKPIRPVAPVTDMFPPFRPKTQEQNEIGFENTGIDRSPSTKQIYIDEYITDSVPEVVAQVEEIVDGLRSGGPGQSFFFESDEVFDVGDALYAFRTRSPSFASVDIVQNIANVQRQRRPRLSCRGGVCERSVRGTW